MFSGHAQAPSCAGPIYDPAPRQWRASWRIQGFEGNRRLRLALPFPLQGPCASTDTACSSSLVAAHLAAEGLEGTADGAALAGGVNVMLLPQTTARICLLQVSRCLLRLLS